MKKQMIINRTVSFFIVFQLLCAVSLTGQVNQNYYIYQSGNRVEAKGQIDGKVLLSDKNMAVVLNKTIEVLESQGGGKLEISNGIYEIDRPIRVRSDVSVYGSGLATILKFNQANKGESVFIAEGANHISIGDLTLQGIEGIASTGVIFDDVMMGAIRNVYSRDFGRYGIQLRNNSSMCEVNSCMTSGNDSAGIAITWCYWGGRAGNAVPNLITACKSYGEDGHAFYLWRTVCNNLVGNLAYQCKGHGFYLREQACSNLITGNRVFSGHKNGVYANWAHETAITGNIFCWNKGHGIEFEFVTWGTISGNNIIDNGDVIDYATEGWDNGKFYGIYLHTDTKSIQVSGNAIFNWPDGHPPMLDGIYEAEDCKFNNITGNNVQFYSGVPVNINGENSAESNNMGNPGFYTEPWLGKFRPDKPSPMQEVKPLEEARARVDALLEKTRK
jgi:parallel beta-helix repeat protein